MEIFNDDTHFVRRFAADRHFQLSASSGVSGRRVELFQGLWRGDEPSGFDLNKLAQFPPAQENVTYFAAGSVISEAFTGVLLWDLLNNAPVDGIVTDPTMKNDILHKVIIVTGTDCYQSVFGAGEIDPFFGGSQIMVAYTTGGQSLGSAGFARIVVPGDKAGGRFVSNIASIEVRDPTINH
jgi:hypothetical protein